MIMANKTTLCLRIANYLSDNGRGHFTPAENMEFAAELAWSIRFRRPDLIRETISSLQDYADNGCETAAEFIAELKSAL